MTTRWLTAMAACALGFVAPAIAAPPAGTVIANQASVAGVLGGAPLAVPSNAVNLTTSAAPLPSASATLVNGQTLRVAPGGTVHFLHVLTNTGSVADSFQLAVANQPGTFDFTALALFADADGNGLPDSATPVTAPVALGPGQSFRFVVRGLVPASAPNDGYDRVEVSAQSVTPGGPAAVTNLDTAAIFVDAPAPPPSNGLSIYKAFTAEEGPSPSDEFTVIIRYANSNLDTSAKRDFTIMDRLPDGLVYVAGSARWTGSGAAALSDAAGGDPAGIAYDFGATMPGAAWAVIANLGPGDAGQLTFRVSVAAGRAAGEVIPNVARHRWTDPQGQQTPWADTSPATYRVTGTIDLTLTGDRVPLAEPGSTVSFGNLLTNRGTLAETFNVTLGAGNFPAGTQVRLFREDGATPLPDTNGDGIADSGVLAPGQSARIVVRAILPATIAPGEYSVQKTAQSVRSPSRRATATDVVGNVSLACRVVVETDNRGRVAPGGTVTYTHYLRNLGNCVDNVTAPAGVLADSFAGWTSSAWQDNPAAGGASLVGLVDATDTAVVPGWSTVLNPGDARRLLVSVTAPAAPVTAKTQGDTNRTTFTLSHARGPLVVRDDTVEDAQAVIGTPEDVIRNFTDPSYRVPSIWAIIGRDVHLRADAPSCNARPDAIETRLVLVTGPGGEREQFTATETGVDTGIFVVDSIPVRLPPVRAGSGIIEGRANDVMDVDLQGCGKPIATTITLIEPSGIVFDSRSNAPVAGAVVSLVKAAGGQCTSTLAPVSTLEQGALRPAANPVTTAADGRFEFVRVEPGDYCVAVVTPNGYTWVSRVPWPQLAPGRNLVVTGPTSGGSYGNAFAIGPQAGPVVLDVPVDPAPLSGLFVQKGASRGTVELGEFVDYSVRVRNAAGRALDRASVTLSDDLPAGFGYVRGTARRAGVAIADPQGGAGPRVVFSLGPLAAGEETTLTYRVRVGPGALHGDGVNRVQAAYRESSSTTLSNVATATVIVVGGVFTDRGYILGRVFLDCRADGRVDPGDLGVPGVRLYLEDGTNVITDGEGKFSFYGIVNRTHVLKVDASSLPAGARLVPFSSRHAGDGASRFVDLKAGDLARADFAIAGCEAAVAAEVGARREAAARSQDEGERLVSQKLEVERTPISDVKALPASGALGQGAVAANPAIAPTPPGIATPPTGSVKPRKTGPAEAGAAPVDLEKLVPGLDPALAFVNLQDGDTLGSAQATIRVKGAAGATFRLAVNGDAVPESRVGKRAVLAEKQVQAWEYIGVELKPGRNTLSLTQVDSFGNERGLVAIGVVAPGRLARVSFEIAAAGAVADGRTPARVAVVLTDASGIPVTARTPVTLEASLGRWEAEDDDRAEPGVQVFVEGGRREFRLQPPTEPGEAILAARSGNLRAEERIFFMPELRQMIAAGVIEGTVALRNLDPRSLVPARDGDGFERELRHFSRTFDDGKGAAGARAAFFLKGKVKGDVLLTAAYDSDKDTRERLFRDIQPDEFYPVYGDASERGFDAQSTGRFYVRVDKGRSWLLYGDFTTQDSTEARKLGNYSRSLTGARLHHEDARLRVNAFASRDSLRQVIEELPANGTSGPYSLGSARGLVNSEKVEIVTRDRSRPAVILSSVPQVRFVDYELEPLTGRILFKAPVASVDRDLNPVSIRITYEVDLGGDKFWVAGGDVSVKLGDRVEVGATYADDRNPADPMKLKGLNAAVQLAARTFVYAEVAQTERPLSSGTGRGSRVELKHDSDRLSVQAFAARTDPEFDNPGSYVSKGRGESGGKLLWKADERTMVRAEVLRTEEVATNAVRDGVMASVERTFDNGLALEAGVRHARESNGPAIATGTGGVPSEGLVPDQVTTVRARLTGPVPGLEGARVYGEAEVDVEDTDRRVLAIGGEYTLPNRGKVYLRHEFVSSITGPYGLNARERQNTSILGVDAEYMRDGRMFSEYRIRDAMSGGDAEAAIGLRNLWTLAEGWKLGTSLERVHALSGSGQNENTAVAFGLEYTADPLWKGSARLELRDAQTAQSLLNTIGVASRVNRDWTFLGRNTLSITRNKDNDGEHVIERMQAGLAWRDDANRANALGRVEHKEERDDTQAGISLKRSTEILSLHADWQPRRPFLVSGRYAAKWTTDKSEGLSTKYRAQMVGGRLTWEFAPKWDVGLAASGLFGEGSATREYGLGLEVGYLLSTNLWLSAGYNFFGYRDDDLTAGDYTLKGPYVRLRYKFDETTFDRLPGGLASASAGAPK